MSGASIETCPPNTRWSCATRSPETVSGTPNIKVWVKGVVRNGFGGKTPGGDSPFEIEDVATSVVEVTLENLGDVEREG